MVSVSSQIPFSWYGTVMVGREPIVESAQCRQMLQERYEEMCSHVLSVTGLTWASKSAAIQVQHTLKKIIAFENIEIEYF